MQRMLVLSDIDGVVANAVEPVLQELWAQFGIALGPSDVTEQNMPDCLWPKVTHVFRNRAAFRNWMWRVVWSNPKVMQNLQPHWEEWAAMRELIEGGGDKLVLDYVTARHQRLAHETHHWLTWWGMVPEVGGLSVRYCTKPKEDVYEELIGCALDRSTDLTVGAEQATPEFVYIVVIEDDVRVAQRVHDMFANESRLIMLVPDRPWTKNWTDKRDFRLTLVELMGSIQ